MLSHGKGSLKGTSKWIKYHWPPKRATEMVVEV